MKLPIDSNYNYINIYRIDSLPASAAITHTPADLFARLLPEDHFTRIFSQIQTKEVKDLRTAEAQYNELREALRNDPAAVNALRLHETEKAKFLRVAANSGLHKVTYEVEKDEDFSAIKKALETLPSGAILRAIEADEKARKITVYSSTFGAWQVADNLFVKNTEAVSKSAGKVRIQFSLRELREPAKLSSDFSRMDCPIYEDLNALFSAGHIERLDKTIEQPDKTWRTYPQYTLFPHHFKKELSEEELKALEVKEEAAKAVKKETSHKSKPQATKEAAAAAVEKNEKEIHTAYPAATDPLAAIQETKEAAIEAFLSRQLQEIQERQARELEEMKIKIENAKRERDAAKTLYISALQKGNTLEEALHHLRAAKFDDVTIAAALEEVKAEMLAASSLEGVIAEKDSVIEKLEKQISGLDKKLEASERARKTNHERYLHEIEKRKRIEAMAEKLAAAGEKLKEKIGAQNVEIKELKDELSEEKQRSAQFEAELEKQAEAHAKEIEKIKQQHAKEVEKIEQKRATEVAELKARIERIEKASRAKDEAISSLRSQLGDAQKAAAKREEMLTTALEETRKEIRGFRQIIEKLQSENEKLRDKIEELSDAKSEVEALRRELAAAVEKKTELSQEATVEAKSTSERIEELQKLAAEVLNNEGKHDPAADNEAAEAEEER